LTDKPEWLSSGFFMPRTYRSVYPVLFMPNTLGKGWCNMLTNNEIVDLYLNICHNSRVRVKPRDLENLLISRVGQMAWESATDKYRDDLLTSLCFFAEGILTLGSIVTANKFFRRKENE